MTFRSRDVRALSVPRIDLRRRSKPGRSFWGRLFGRFLSYDLRIDGAEVSLRGAPA